MIVLDTHVWVWWVHGDPRLTANEADAIGVSAISCWEVGKLVEYGPLDLGTSVRDWLSLALGYPGVRLVELPPEIAAASTSLPRLIHRDLADQIIIASSLVNGCPLLTSDQKLIEYLHVETIA